MLLDPAAPGSIRSIPKQFFRGKTCQWRYLEESGQWLESVDRTHLEMASGKLVLQKKLTNHKATNYIELLSLSLNLLILKTKDDIMKAAKIFIKNSFISWKIIKSVFRQNNS